MTPLTVHRGRVFPLDRADVDTDQIIPKQFLKRIQRTGFGQFLFYDWRFEPDGREREFPLNEPRYREATILLARRNFGCGSSREHAPWALLDYGFRVLVAPSFADIFYNNCFQNGILPVVLPEATVDDLFVRASGPEPLTLEVDLPAQVIRGAGEPIPFEIDEFRKDALIRGLDEIGRTLHASDLIDAYEKTRCQDFLAPVH